MQKEFESILEQVKGRRTLGAVKYGEDSFLRKDNLVEAEEELMDLINYALFEIVKLRRLRLKLNNNQ